MILAASTLPVIDALGYFWRIVIDTIPFMLGLPGDLASLTVCTYRVFVRSAERSTFVKHGVDHCHMLSIFGRLIVSATERCGCAGSLSMTDLSRHLSRSVRNGDASPLLEYLQRGRTDWSPHSARAEVQREYDRVWSLVGSQANRGTR